MNKKDLLMNMVFEDDENKSDRLTDDYHEEFKD